MGREITEGPLFSKLKLESFWTSEMADVEAGDTDFEEAGGGPGKDLVVGKLAIGGGKGEKEGDEDPGEPGDSSGTSLSLSDVSELSPRSSLGLLAIFQQFLHPTIFSPSSISTEVNILNNSSMLGMGESLFQRVYPFCVDGLTLETPDNKAEKGLLVFAGVTSARICRRYADLAAVNFCLRDLPLP